VSPCGLSEFLIYYRKASLWAENCPNFFFFLFGPAKKTTALCAKGQGKDFFREKNIRSSFFNLQDRTKFPLPFGTECGKTTGGIFLIWTGGMKEGNNDSLQGYVSNKRITQYK
jgi:hypothetical protein